jgi:hypothetical protein
MTTIKLESLDVTALTLQSYKFSSGKEAHGRFLNPLLGGKRFALDVACRAPFGISTDSKYPDSASIGLALDEPQQQEAMQDLHDGLAQLLADHSQDLWKRQYSREEIKNFVLKSPMLGNIVYAKITKATKYIDNSQEESEPFDKGSELPPQSNVRVVLSVPALHFKDLTSGKILLRVEKLQVLPPSDRAPMEQPNFDFVD